MKKQWWHSYTGEKIGKFYFEDKMSKKNIHGPFASLKKAKEDALRLTMDSWRINLKQVVEMLSKARNENEREKAHSKYERYGDKELKRLTSIHKFKKASI